MTFKERLGRLVGYEFIRLKKQPSLKSHLRTLFDHYRIDLALDVGANHGSSDSCYASVVIGAGSAPSSPSKGALSGLPLWPSRMVTGRHTSSPSVSSVGRPS
jgi:hypothetical protein